MVEMTCEVAIEVNSFKKLSCLLKTDGMDKMSRDELFDVGAEIGFFDNVYLAYFKNGFSVALDVFSDEIGYWDELALLDDKGEVVCQVPPEYDLCNREIEYDGTLYKVKIKTFGYLK